MFHLRLVAIQRCGTIRAVVAGSQQNLCWSLRSLQSHLCRNLALGGLTWLWNIFCIGRPSYVPPKSLWCKEVLEDPQVFLEGSRESSLLRSKMRLSGIAGEWNLLLAKISCLKCQTKPIDTTFKHNRQAHIGLWAVRPKTAPKSSPVSAQTCSIWAQTQTGSTCVVFRRHGITASSLKQG